MVVRVIIAVVLIVVVLTLLLWGVRDRPYPARLDTWRLPEIFSEPDLGTDEMRKVVAGIRTDRTWVLKHLALVDYCPVGYTLSTSQDGTRTLTEITVPQPSRSLRPDNCREVCYWSNGKMQHTITCPNYVSVAKRDALLLGEAKTDPRARPFALGGSRVTKDVWARAKREEEALRQYSKTVDRLERTTKALEMGYVSKDEFRQRLDRDVCDHCGDPYTDHSPWCGSMAPPTLPVHCNHCAGCYGGETKHEACRSCQTYAASGRIAALRARAEEYGSVARQLDESLEYGPPPPGWRNDAMPFPRKRVLR